MTVAVVGAGWLGSAIGVAIGREPVARRNFSPEDIDGTVVVVASGRSRVADGEPFALALHDELSHLRAVLDASVRSGVAHIVVIGSSDVAGMAPVVRGDSLQAPRTPYARIKAAVEDECVMRRARGEPVTVVRLAPVHGYGKHRTTQLVRLARLPVIPLPGAGRHSTGFVLLADAVAAILELGRCRADKLPPVVAIGGGEVPLRRLLYALARAQGRTMHVLPLPAMEALGRWLRGMALPDRVEWVLRLALPRAVMMEAPVPVTDLARAAEELVNC